MKGVRYDAIILPGGGVSLDGGLSTTAKVRLDRAAQILKAGDTQAIIVCGSHGYKEDEKPILSEAQAYASYLKELGVPDNNVHLEAQSQESLGNLLFAKMRIVMQHDWHAFLVIPTYGQSTERIDYLMQKIFGDDYTWDILRVGENKDPANLAREAKSLMYTKAINDVFADGDHETIYKWLMETHPAYGSTKWTVEQLREELKS